MAGHPHEKRQGRIPIAAGVVMCSWSFFATDYGGPWLVGGLFFVCFGLTVLLGHPGYYTPAKTLKTGWARRVKLPLPRPPGALPQTRPAVQRRSDQVADLFNEALKANTADSLVHFAEFCARFRRLAPYNAHLLWVQRPGVRAAATKAEWLTMKRDVAPDASPMLILKAFGPVAWVYDVEDTLPVIDRASIGDPFYATSRLDDHEIKAALSRLTKTCQKQNDFRIEIVLARLGYDRAGSAAAQGRLPLLLPVEAVQLAHTMAVTGNVTWVTLPKPGGTHRPKLVPVFRIKINDRMTAAERLVTLAHELGHIFCGHLGAVSSGKNAWPDRQRLGYHEREMEAEAVAWIIAKRALIIGGSAAYLKHHVQQGNVSEVDEDVVARAASRIESLAGIRYGAPADG